ncbi:unnamed protein product [Chrysoparadoxa australica]
MRVVCARSLILVALLAVDLSAGASLKSTALDQTGRLSKTMLTGGGAGPKGREGAVAKGKAGAERSFVCKARGAFFPVYKGEFQKFFVMGFLKFFIIFVLTLTRDMKDTLVVTHCGAEAISFLKVLGVLPAATAFTLFYAKISTILTRRKLFYIALVPFFAFFVLFDRVLYPMRESLHFSGSTALKAFDLLPEGFSYLINLVQHWTFALFYIISELYSSVSIGVVFWQFANDVVPVDQAKRMYPLFGQVSSLAPVVAGQFVVHFATGKGTTFDRTLRYLTTLIACSGVTICLLYEAGRNISQKELRASGAAAVKEPEVAVKKQKQKPGLRYTFRLLSQSQYLRYLSILVVGYGLSISLTEVMWKSLVKQQYPSAVEYQRFMGRYSSALGISTFTVIFAGSNLIKYMGWRSGALATPLTMGAIALPLFSLLIMGHGDLHGSALSFVVYLGAVQSILSKATKCALFDPTTQMSYIPLDDDSKVKGKAAIDGLGSRVGKSLGSLLQQFLVLTFGSLLAASPLVAIMFYAVIGAWVSAAAKLSVLFEAKQLEALKKGGKRR